MNELEEILELLGEEQLEELKGELFLLLANCVASQHFQVVERTLFLWNNETLCSQGCLSRRYTPELLPMIYGDLYEKSEGHWNATVLGLAQNVLKMYHDSDMATYQDCQANYLSRKEAKLLA